MRNPGILLCPTFAIVGTRGKLLMSGTPRVHKLSTPPFGLIFPSRAGPPCSCILCWAKVADSIVERYKQAARTGLLSEVLQEGAAVFGALLLRCPLPVRNLSRMVVLQCFISAWAHVTFGRLERCPISWGFGFAYSHVFEEILGRTTANSYHGGT